MTGTTDRPLSPGEVVDQFFSAMADAGVAPSDRSVVVADGALRRFHVQGEKRASKNGWLVLHGDGVPAGEFGTWKDAGSSHTWHASIGRELSAAELAESRSRIEAARAARAVEQEAERERARKKAQRLWKEARPRVTVTHPYLVAKGAKPYGIRQLGEQLVIPVRAGKALVGLQFIGWDAEAQSFKKTFLTGTPKRGAYFRIGGAPGADGVIGIAEGFATAATVHELTGWPICCAFDANLRPVAEALRAKLPNVRLVILADNDHGTEGNPGLTKAREAAAAVGGAVVAPEFEPGETGTDWNDACAAWGAERARAALLRGVEATPAVEVEASAQAAPAAPVEVRAAPPANDAPAPGRKVLKFPDKKRKPEPQANAGRPSRDACPPGFSVDDEAVWFRDAKAKSSGEPPLRVCPPLRVIAFLRDTVQDNWSLLLEWKDRDGHTHQWVMPEPMFRASGEELRGELLRQGFRVPLPAERRALFMHYLDQARPTQAARIIDRIGWHDLGASRAYVLPGRVIGNPSEMPFYESDGHQKDVFRSAGELSDWRSDVAELCRGNSRLLFGVSMAFASMLMHVADDESGGAQLVGDSSMGKSTVQYVAASVFGGPTFVDRWKGTANSIEGVAYARNDALLILDEQKDALPEEVGAIVFTLAGGSSKNRMNRNESLRAKKRWRLLFLSTAEKKLATLMAQAKQKPDAGHAVRMAEFRAEVGPGTVFETLHGHAGGAEFARALKAAAAHVHGTAAPAFIEAVLRRIETLADDLRASRTAFCASVLPLNSDGQAHRVAMRFALIAFAGELAAREGITAWDADEAAAAVRTCFWAWLEMRGGSANVEPKRMVAQVRYWIERHGQARCTSWNGDKSGAWIPKDHAGFRKAGSLDGAMESSDAYYIFHETFREDICVGFDPLAVARALYDAGALKRDEASRKYTRREHLPGIGKTKCYVILPTIWATADGNDASEKIGEDERA